MARKPRSPNVNKPVQSNGFVDALKFCGGILSDKGSPNETHILLNNKTVTAFNGIIAAGHIIEEDIYAAPNNKLIIDAMVKCGQTYSFVQLDNNRLSIKSDKFKAIVPCIDPMILSGIMPDNPVAKIDDKLKIGLEILNPLVNENAQRILLASILIQSGSMLATNGSLILEYWHGIDLPTLTMPKSIVDPVTKTNKKLFEFGFGHSSVTFWFEDRSWIRSQLFNEPWPLNNVKAIFNRDANLWPIPNGFWEGVEAVAPFSETGDVYFGNEIIKSHPIDSDGVGATYEVAGLPKGPIFNIKNLMMIKPHVKMIDFLAKGDTNSTTMLMFQGDNLRGAMLGKT